MTAADEQRAAMGLPSTTPEEVARGLADGYAPRHLRFAEQLAAIRPSNWPQGADGYVEAIATRLAEWEAMVEEQGREQVRAYARRVAGEERERLATYRREAIESLDPSRSASAAVEYALRAAQSSAVVVHLSVVGSWQP